MTKQLQALLQLYGASWAHLTLGFGTAKQEILGTGMNSCTVGSPKCYLIHLSFSAQRPATAHCMQCNYSCQYQVTACGSCMTDEVRLSFHTYTFAVGPVLVSSHSSKGPINIPGRPAHPLTAYLPTYMRIGCPCRRCPLVLLLLAFISRPRIGYYNVGARGSLRLRTAKSRFCACLTHQLGTEIRRFEGEVYFC